MRGAGLASGRLPVRPAPETPPSLPSPPSSSPATTVRPDILLPMLADQWLGLIRKAVHGRETASSTFQLDLAGGTRRFETVIRDLDTAPPLPALPVLPPAEPLPAIPTDSSADPEGIQVGSQILERMNTALQKLACNTSKHAQNLIVALREITEAAGGSLNVERAGVWVYMDGEAKLRCLDLFEKTAGAHSSGTEIEAQAYPAYFAALRDHRVVEAHVAQKDPRTHEFASDYLVPLGITSLLDAPIRRDGNLIGVVCLEHVGPARRWTTEEVAFAGSLADLIAMIVESSERRRAEAALKHSHSLLNAAFNSTADGIVIADCNGIITGFNQRFLDMWKVPAEQVSKKKAADFIEAFAPQMLDEADYREKCTAILDNPESEVCDTFEFKDGRVYERTSKPQRLDDRIVGRVCCYRDVTEQRKSAESSQSLERMLQQTKKVEALGTLAGGIAHDFNNILTAILGHAELAQVQTSDPAVLSSLSEIFKASDRAKHLVKQILTFCRQRPPERKVQKLRPLLEEVSKLLKATLPPQIELKQDFDPNQSSACIDPVQLHQVLMNLCTNASHAMKEKGGILRIGEALVSVSEAAAPSYPGLKPGPHAHLWVTDNGCGMSQETLQRIFEPFFTTKPVGEGTGLGLSVVHGIIRSHEGIITVESEIGRGTTFHIYIPAVRTAAEPGDSASAIKESPRGKGERIMYVDDESSVCQFVRQALDMLGYQVSTHTHPVEALEYFRTRSNDFDLVITDMGMPRVNGLEFASRIQKMAPGIPIILMSGNDSGVPFPTLAKAGIRRLVTKPVSCRDLSVVVHEVIEMHRTKVEDEMTAS